MWRLILTGMVAGMVAEAGPLRLDATRTMTIVLPAEASVTENFAAAELQRYLGRITGQTPQLGDGPGYRWQVGRTPAAAKLAVTWPTAVAEARDERFAISLTEAEAVLVGSGDRGTLYAVYALLERLGCRWLEPGPQGEVVPRHEQLSLETGLTISAPAFTVRHLGAVGRYPTAVSRQPQHLLETIDWMVKNRLNYSFNHRLPTIFRSLDPADRDVWQKRGGMAEWQHICHNVNFMLRTDELFKTHPEYFSLYKGRRLPLDNEGGYICTTNPDVRRLLVDYCRDWFSNHADGTVIPICPPDGGVKWCEDEACLAQGGRNFMTGPDGSMTRRQVDLINYVADALRDEFPGRYILNLAYSRYTYPYPGVSHPANVTVQVAHGYGGNGSLVHSIYSPRNAEARQVFEQWRDSGAGGIGIWDYFILHVPDGAGSALTPLGLTRVARDMTRYLAGFPQPYKVYFTQAGDELWQANAFLYYALARLVWDPEQTVDALAEDFCRAAFGAAWQPARAYLLRLEAAYDTPAWQPKIWRDITVPSPIVFSERVLANARLDLDAIASLLAADNALGHDLLQRWRRSLDYVAATVEPKRLLGPRGVWRLQRGESAYVINADAGQANDDAVAKVAAKARAADLVDDSLARVLFRCRYRHEPVIALKAGALEVGVLPGIGGRILRLRHADSPRNLLYEPPTDGELSDPGIAYFRYGGYEEYSTRTFASPGWETPMTIAEQTPTSIRMQGVDGKVAFSRQIALQADSRVVISTTLRNMGTVPRQSMLRVHPEFQLAPLLDDTELFVETGGHLVGGPLLTIDSLDERQPDGRWGLFDRRAAVAVVHSYPPGAAKAFIHIDRIAQSVNIELFGPEALLEPGAELSFSHAYQVLTGDQARALVDRIEPWSASVAAPAAAAPAAAPGHAGDACLPAAAPPLYLNGVPAAVDVAGTFSCWFQLTAAATAVENGIFFSCGNKQPDWMVLALRQGELVWYRNRGAAPFDGPDEAWNKVTADVSDLQAGQYHHLALTWSRDDAQPDLAQIYVDGQLRAARYDLHLLGFGHAPTLCIGAATAKHGWGRFPGTLDGVHISRGVRGPRQIAAAALAADDGAGDDDTVILLTEPVAELPRPAVPPLTAAQQRQAHLQLLRQAAE